jgi:hypothetical protein
MRTRLTGLNWKDYTVEIGGCKSNLPQTQRPLTGLLQPRRSQLPCLLRFPFRFSKHLLEAFELRADLGHQQPVKIGQGPFNLRQRKIGFMVHRGSTDSHSCPGRRAESRSRLPGVQHRNTRVPVVASTRADPPSVLPVPAWEILVLDFKKVLAQCHLSLPFLLKQSAPRRSHPSIMRTPATASPATASRSRLRLPSSVILTADPPRPAHPAALPARLQEHLRDRFGGHEPGDGDGQQCQTLAKEEARGGSHAVSSFVSQAHVLVRQPHIRRRLLQRVQQQIPPGIVRV